MTDDARLIDAEVWAFIREVERFYPPETAGASIAEQRRLYNEMAAAFEAPFPADVRAHDAPIGGVPCRIYEAGGGAGVCVYYHGGGFVVGSPITHDSVCAEICAGAGLRVVSVDYRLSPEHRHPAAFQDALAAARGALALYGGPLVLAGDSAGGNLAAAAAAELRGAVARQVLIYPGLGAEPSGGSYERHAKAPMLTREDVIFYSGVRGAAPDDATAAPLKATDFSGLPPTVIVTAECDPLSDDGRIYRDRLIAAGGRAVWIEEQGLVHGFLRARRMSGRARAAFARIVAAIKSPSPPFP